MKYYEKDSHARLTKAEVEAVERHWRESRTVPRPLCRGEKWVFRLWHGRLTANLVFRLSV